MRLGGIGRSAAAARNGACTGTLFARHTRRWPVRGLGTPRETSSLGGKRPHAGGAAPPRSQGRRSRHVELGGEVLVVARDNRVDVLGERLREMPRACRGHAGARRLGPAPTGSRRLAQLAARRVRGSV